MFYTFRVKGAKAIKQFKGTEVIVTNPLLLPDVKQIEEYYEPFVIGEIYSNICIYKRVSKIHQHRHHWQVDESAEQYNY